eukprot:TRINITY_DN2675_c0_g3_i1.p1 TRINITY_DN2675_c0_g3~~TRINITY_DN2675_c0_g3_i1.p1  ORF type:complete len:174 (+),score=7.62 TRINITY_DN2675_c0_g3_i1:166-687(+)
MHYLFQYGCLQCDLIANLLNMAVCTTSMIPGVIGTEEAFGKELAISDICCPPLTAASPLDLSIKRWIAETRFMAHRSAPYSNCPSNSISEKNHVFLSRGGSDLQRPTAKSDATVKRLFVGHHLYALMHDPFCQEEASSSPPVRPPCGTVGSWALSCSFQISHPSQPDLWSGNQ